MLALEKKLTMSINEGFITKFDDMMEYLRNQWRKTNVPKVFQTPIKK